MKQFTFELFPSHTLHVGLFDKVTNSEQLLQAVINGKLDVALLNPSLVCIFLSPSHIHIINHLISSLHLDSR